MHINNFGKHFLNGEIRSGFAFCLKFRLINQPGVKYTILQVSQIMSVKLTNHLKSNKESNA